MSERSKGDVSSSSSSLSASSSRVNNNRVVKNPLLSASVTGLSFDDFPNKPLLLPAAPPVVHAPPPQPTTALIAGILNRGKCVRDGARRGVVTNSLAKSIVTCCFPFPCCNWCCFFFFPSRDFNVNSFLALYLGQNYIYFVRVSLPLSFLSWCYSMLRVECER